MRSHSTSWRTPSASMTWYISAAAATRGSSCARRSLVARRAGSSFRKARIRSNMIFLLNRTQWTDYCTDIRTDGTGRRFFPLVGGIDARIVGQPDRLLAGRLPAPASRHRCRQRPGVGGGDRRGKSSPASGAGPGFDGGCRRRPQSRRPSSSSPLDRFQRYRSLRRRQRPAFDLQRSASSCSISWPSRSIGTRHSNASSLPVTGETGAQRSETIAVGHPGRIARRAHRLGEILPDAALVAGLGLLDVGQKQIGALARLHADQPPRPPRARSCIPARRGRRGATASDDSALFCFSDCSFFARASRSSTASPGRAWI